MTIGMVKVLMAYAPGRSELAFEIRFDSLSGISFCTQYYFDISFVEDINSSSAHSAADDDVDSFISEKVRQESGSVARLGRVCEPVICLSSMSKRTNSHNDRNALVTVALSLATAILFTSILSPFFP